MRVWYLTHRLPYSPNRGDRIRSFHLLEALRAAMDVSLVSLVHDDEEEAQVPAIAARGIAVTTGRVSRVARWVRAVAALPGSTPLTHVLLDAPGLQRSIDRLVRETPPDVVLAFCSGMARFALSPSLAGVPLVLDMVDVDSEKWRSLGDVASLLKSWVYRREARVLSDFERVATERAVTTLVVNEKERTVLRALAPNADVRVLTSGVDVEAFAPPGPPEPSAITHRLRFPVRPSARALPLYLSQLTLQV